MQGAGKGQGRWRGGVRSAQGVARDRPRGRGGCVGAGLLHVTAQDRPGTKRRGSGVGRGISGKLHWGRDSCAKGLCINQHEIEGGAQRAKSQKALLSLSNGDR